MGARRVPIEAHEVWPAKGQKEQPQIFQNITIILAKINPSGDIFSRAHVYNAHPSGVHMGTQWVPIGAGNEPKASGRAVK